MQTPSTTWFLSQDQQYFESSRNVITQYLSEAIPYMNETQYKKNTGKNHEIHTKNFFADTVFAEINIPSTPTFCYSWYGLPLYAYLIRRTGTFIFLLNNLATPLFLSGTPFIPHMIQTPLFLSLTRLYSNIYDTFIISSYDSSLSTNTYIPYPP